MSEPEHEGIVCDVCDEEGKEECLVGTRFKCLKCDDYDLCKRHYQKREEFHPKDHDFIEIKFPNVSAGLPLDAIGLIVQFIESSEVFFNICLSSKATREYLFRSPHAAEHVVFKYKNRPKKQILYARKVLVEGKKMKSSILLKFPSLKKLVLSQIKGMKDLKRLDSLESLTIDNCKNLTKFIDSEQISKVLPQLRTLKIDASHSYDWKSQKPYISRWIGDMSRLESLSIDFIDVNAKKFKMGIEKIAPTLRKLRITGTAPRHYNLSEMNISKLTNLEDLYISRCRVQIADLRPLKKLRKLTLLRNEGGWGEDADEVASQLDLPFLSGEDVVFEARRRKKGKIKRKPPRKFKY